MTGGRPVLMGVLVLAVIAAAPVVVVWVVPRVAAAAGRLWSRGRGVPAPTVAAIEGLVADLHRLRRELCGPDPSTQVRRAALLAAYDGVLLDVCRAVEVEPAGLVEAAGRERDLARLRTEAALEAAGIVLDPPRRAV